jgi:hypothetical protein
MQIIGNERDSVFLYTTNSQHKSDFVETFAGLYTCLTMMDLTILHFLGSFM